MTALLHQTLSGLATGGVYASLALALVMVYRGTHHLNFAQGEMATFSTYIALMLIQAGLPYWVAFALTIVIAFVLGVAVERLVMRRMARALAAGGGRRGDRPAADLQRAQRLAVRLHDQAVPQPVRGARRRRRVRRAGVGS